MPDVFIDHKLVFMHNPKCGSRTLRNIALQLLEQYPSRYFGALNNNQLCFVDKNNRPRIVDQMIQIPVPPSENYTWEHCNVLGVYRLLKRFKIDPKGFTFLYVIRHPQHRYFSGYRYNIKTGTLTTKTTFSDYIMKNEKITGATKLNLFPIEKFSVNHHRYTNHHHCIRLENFTTELKGFLANYGFQTDKIDCNTHLHESTGYQFDTPVSFSPIDLDFIRDHWAEDFRLGGYQIMPDLSF